jgi:glycosyltransferase involved in cell wall biosynthesis
VSADSLRVLLVTTSLMRGGAEVQVYLLARELAVRGGAVHVVSMRDPEAYQNELAEIGVPVTSLRMRRGVPDPRALFRLASVVRRWRPNVVHSHMVHANLLARLARPLAWAPVQLSTAHNVIEGGRAREIAYRLTDALSDLTTNVCEAGVARYVSVGAVPRHKIRAMPNGLDLIAFDAQGRDRSATREEFGFGDAFVWLAVGRLEEAKDYPTMLESIRLARERGPRFTVLVVSEGPLWAALEARRDALGIPAEEVRFLGARSDVPDLMRVADAYLMSSAWEGLPMVLLEAAAAALPIVATDVGGNHEVVEDGVNGRLVPARDPVALAAAMGETMALDRAQREALGHAGRRAVEARYRIEAVVDRWEALYRELLERAAGRT